MNEQHAATAPEMGADGNRAVIEMAGVPLAAAMKELERQYLGHVMTKARGNQAAAARLAGLADDTFRKKLKRYTLRTSYVLD